MAQPPEERLGAGVSLLPEQGIKFRLLNAGHESEDVVVYAPGNPSAPSGSGLLGCGADKIAGIAWPSNVVEAKAEVGL
jgi:hypothetical protein